mmetsp:Transcript_115548/g.323044  ORF Transcript_115548/g.323044 Transcript_115548/m.323044 type:complete len:234 (+) Transcript_115548:281-982(+)
MYGGYGGGMYGGMGMGMGMGGMYGGGYGMMPMGPYAESMARMSQMMEMNSLMLEQLQQHVSMTFNRCRDVAVWIYALRGTLWQRGSGDKAKAEEEKQKEQQQAEEQHQQQLEQVLVPDCYASKDAQRAALERVQRRVRVLALLFFLFLAYVFRDSRRRTRRLKVEGAWLKAAEGLLPVVAAAAAVAPTAQAPQPQQMGMGGMRGMGGMYGMGGMSGMGGMGGMGYGSSLYRGF